MFIQHTLNVYLICPPYAIRNPPYTHCAQPSLKYDAIQSYAKQHKPINNNNNKRCKEMQSTTIQYGTMQ